MGGGARAWGQGPTASQTLNTLQTTYPGVQVHESGGRIKAVYGVPMTAGATPKQAAENWLALYAPVFGEPAPVLPEYSAVRLKSGKTVVSYRQTIDGVPVMNGLVTVVVLNGPTPRAVSAAGRVATRPAGGLGPVSVFSAQAQVIAQAHPAAAGLTSWREPEQAAWWVDAPGASAEAVRVWVCEGWGADAARVFLVNAATGAVLHHYDPIAHFDVSGTISAYVSPGLGPHTAPFMQVPPCNPPPTSTNCCPNPPTLLVPLANLRVRAIHPTTGATLYETFTATDGSYSLPVPNGVEVKVKVPLEGPYWWVLDGRDCMGMQWPLFTGPPPHETSPARFAPFTWPSQPFNSPTGDEFYTANVNAAHHIEKTWTYFISRIETDELLPGLHELCGVMANARRTGECAMGSPFSVASPNFFIAPPLVGSIALTSAYSSVANNAFSTPLSHEYGHFVSWRMRNINPFVPGQGVHDSASEGYADSLAHLVHDTRKIGEKLTNDCGFVFRDPFAPSARLYPTCAIDTYERGMLLSGVWWDILLNMRALYCPTPPCSPDIGLEKTRQLHVDWSMLMMGGQSYTCVLPPPQGPTDLPQAAHRQTLVEVLTADDDDGNLSNGTPHRAQICAAFASHCICDLQVPSVLCPGITCPAPGVPCPESAGGLRSRASTCAADCDGDGGITVGDVACFHRAFAAGSRKADCNGDARLTIGDFTCFHQSVTLGCP